MKQVLYVASSESKEIHVWNINEDGKLTLLQQLILSNKVQPMQISPDGRHLYVGTKPDFSIITYFISDKGELSQKYITTIPSTPTHIEIDKFGCCLFISSYHQGNLLVLPINKLGIPQPAIQIINNLKNPHLSAVNFNNSHLFVTCLGEDHIRVYSINNRHLTELISDKIIINPGSGPRHLIFAPNHKSFYCLNELNATINVYLSFKPYKQKQSCNILPIKSKCRPWASDIHITPDGCNLYVSERSTHIIRHFRVIDNGLKLLPMLFYKTENQPRSFNIDKTGNFLIVAGQKSDHITVYKIDTITGALQALNRYQVGKEPVWITFHVIKN